MTVCVWSWPSLPPSPGLQILYTLLQNVAQEEAAAQSFYQTYFCDILQHIFSVVTDTSHTAGEPFSRPPTPPSSLVAWMGTLGSCQNHSFYNTSHRAVFPPLKRPFWG